MKSTVIVFFLKIRKGNTSICVNSYNKLHSDLLYRKKKLTQITKVLQFFWRREHSFSDSKQIFQIVQLPFRKCVYVIKPSICEVYHCVEQQCKTKGNLERITLVKQRHFLFCDCLKLCSPSKIEKNRIPFSSKHPDIFPMYAVHLLCGSAFRYLLPHHYFLYMPIFAPVQLAGFPLARKTVYYVYQKKLIMVLI